MMRALLGFFGLTLAALAVAQSTPPPVSAPSSSSAGYTPDPVSTTHQLLTGRLFFSDAERERLDQARKDGVQIVDGEVVVRSPKLDGFVKSNDGRTIYWVDGGQRLQRGALKTLSVPSNMTGPESPVVLRESVPVTDAATKATPKPRAAKPSPSRAPLKPVAVPTAESQ